MTVQQCLQDMCGPNCWRDDLFPKAEDSLPCLPGSLLQTKTDPRSSVRIAVLLLILCGCREQSSRVDSNRIPIEKDRVTVIHDSMTLDPTTGAASTGTGTSNLRFEEMNLGTTLTMSYANGQQAGEKAAAGRQRRAVRNRFKQSSRGLETQRHPACMHSAHSSIRPSPSVSSFLPLSSPSAPGLPQSRA